MEKLFTIEDFRDLIERYDSIVIYRHISPDYDAYGSQLGLYLILKENYPDKKIYTWGKEAVNNPDYIIPMDNPDIDVVRGSLVVSVDTSNRDRVDGDYFDDGIENVKIDHHPDVDCYTTYTYVDTTASSCSQIILEMAMKFNWKITLPASYYIYSGISTDTLHMTIDKVDGRLFSDIAYLLDTTPGFRINDVNRLTYDQPINQFMAEHQIAGNIQFEGDTAFNYVSLEDMARYNLKPIDCKGFVNMMEHIRGVDKYVLFIQDDKTGLWNVSLRAHAIPISDIAVKYGGGGHPLASGVSKVSYETTQLIKKEIVEKK